MRSTEQREYRRLYEEQKRQGKPFWPDVLFKDAVVALGVLIVLYVLAALVGTPLEEPADPMSTVEPRPEWYFLWFFQALKYFPGSVEFVAVVGIPLLLLGALVALPFVDDSPRRHWRDRPWVTRATIGVVGTVVALSVLALDGTGPAPDEAQASPLAEGESLFAANCAVCHGSFGEGGPNPVDPGDVLAPISTLQYLSTHTDATINAIISKGQPALGMAPFAVTDGGPLRPGQVESVVAFIRSWEQDPPVETPPDLDFQQALGTTDEVFAGVCASCHGVEGAGTALGPSLVDPEFQSAYSDEEIFDTINLGHEATAMIAWGDIIPARLIQELVALIRGLGRPAPPSDSVSFATDVLPVFQISCTGCHGSAGGWDATSLEAALSTGDHSPVVIVGDADNSLLVQKMVGTHTEGAIMPPSGALSEDVLQLVIDWINSGAAP